VPREPPPDVGTGAGSASTNRGPRLPPIAVPRATPGVQYHFDQAGRFTGATETINNTTREYDAAGRVIRTFVRDKGRVVVFDADGRAIQHTGGGP
jgi:YD repeat-containing protein